MIVIAQNRGTGKVGEDADSRRGKRGRVGGKGAEGLEDIRGKTKRGSHIPPHVRREFRKDEIVAQRYPPQ